MVTERMQIPQMRSAGFQPAFDADPRRPERMGATAVAGPAGASLSLSVQIATAEEFEAVSSQWRELVSRSAEPNVFQEPAYVVAADSAAGGATRTLLAWQDRGRDAARLVGAWTLRTARPRSGIPVRVLMAPAVPDYGFLSTPVVDRDVAAEALRAMLDELVADPAFPKIVFLRSLGAGGPVEAALQGVLATRNSPATVLGRRQRAKLVSPRDGAGYFERALSSSTRKKLRQHRRRLSQHGPVTTTSHRGIVEGVQAFEQFLRLEAASWKGKAGTAILCSDADAAFARDAFRRMAADGCAWVEALHTGDQVIGAQVLMRSGSAAFTWKIAHDESFGDFSPGVLLVEDYSAKLLSDLSLDFADSCSFNDEGFMADLWKERQGVIDLCFDARPGGSLAFPAVTATERLYRLAREQAKSTKHALQKKRLDIARALRKPTPQG